MKGLRELRDKLIKKSDEEDKGASLETKSNYLRTLNTNYGHMYAGTVPYAVVEGRRAKNKAARKARRITRSRSK